MKYFIAFAFFFLTNCLVPTGISAATNPTNAAVHSVVLPVKKMTSKQKTLLKWSKKDEKKWVWHRFFFIIGVVLILLGVVLMLVGANKHAQKQATIANPGSVLAINLDGLTESLLGASSLIVGFISLLIGRSTQKSNAKRNDE